MKQRNGAQVMAIAGPYAVYEPYCNDALRAVASMTFPLAGWVENDEGEEVWKPENSVEVKDAGSRIACFRFSGPMTKEETCASYSMGGFSTMSAAKAVQAACDSGEFSGIAISWYTPGGQTAYMDTFASILRDVNSKVPIWSYAEDMCCSAGIWAAVQSTQFWCSKNSIVGSIGTYMTIEDSSKAAENAGYEVVVIKAGEHKGDGTPGTPVTEAIRKRYQATVDSLNDTFIADLATGRGITSAEARKLNTGDVWVGQEAVNKGLCDSVGSFEDMISAMSASLVLAKNGVVPGMSSNIQKNGVDSKEENLMDEKSKISFVTSLLAFLGIGSKEVVGDLQSAEKPAVIAPATPVTTPAVAPVASAVEALSAEDKAALVAGREALALKAKEEAEAKSKEEGDEEEDAAQSEAELKREESIAAYVKAYNQVNGAGSITVKAATNKLKLQSQERIDAIVTGLQGTAKELFGESGSRKTQAVSQTEHKLTRSSMAGSGIY
jgi:signal peptide peptidase SppA